MIPQRLTLALLTSYFGLCGLTYGGQGVLLAEMMKVLGLSKGAYGSAVLAPPLVGFLLLVLGGQITNSIGKKNVALAGLTLFAAASLLLSIAGGLVSFVGALIVLGAAYGAMEMAMNAGTLDWEAATGRSVMNFMHAAFSGGAIAGAGLAGILLQRGLSYPRIFVLLAALNGLVICFSLLAPFPPAAAAQDERPDMIGALRLLFQNRGLRVLASIGMCGVVGESVANSWSVIHFRSLGAAALVGGGSYALFNAGMFIGRLANAPLVARWGARISLVVSGGLLVVSGILLMAPGNLPMAIAAFALAGFGVAGVIPTVLSAAAGYAPGRSAEVTGGILGVVYLAMAICGPLVGWVAELVTLRLAMIAVGASGVAIFGLASGLQRETK